jgi:hypothetical protein
MAAIPVVVWLVGVPLVFGGGGYIIYRLVS